MVVAIVALVVAMVGTGYAAVKLPKNSVGTKQLKKNSVTTAKIKKNAVTGAKVKKKTLTGSDINLKKLGTVPNAGHAGTADLANAIAPLEGSHRVGSAGEPGFESGTSNAGSLEGIQTQPVGFYKDHEGIVHLEGLIKSGPTSPVIAFKLPAGYRPATNTVLFFTAWCSGLPCSEQTTPVIVGGGGTVVSGINIEGAVVIPAESITSLDGISFRAAS
jgi:hypothetical protein